ncbi:MAG: hypothetical protein K6E76_00485 [Patescibacteria group bacterium]|nr:hypothetical protein [Patescibacteria group bacterium]
MERYGIDKGKREQKKFDDGGTGLFAITNYYLSNKNNPQAQAFCKEYEEKILP